MEKIKDCPCCGGPGMLKDICGKIRHGWVGCPACRLFINWNISPAGAVATWNRRAVPSSALRAPSPEGEGKRRTEALA